MKYINLFETQAAYDAADKYYPNVSYIEATDEIVYQETDPTMIVAKFTTTSANQSATIAYYKQSFTNIIVDGEPQTISGTGSLSYTFATAGEHDVKYKLANSSTVGNNVFQGCNKMTSVTIPEQITSMGEYVFKNCSALTSVQWNAKNCSDFTVNYGGSKSAFADLTNLNTFVFGNGVEYIPGVICWGLTGLTSVTISNSVTSIGMGAFYNCTGLTSITIPNSVTEIGGEVFENCSGLTSLTIPDSVTSMGIFLMKGCSSLTNVIIGNSVTRIQDQTFNGCTALTSVVIGSSVTSFGDSCFVYNDNLTSMTLLPTTPPSIYSSSIFGVPATCPIYVPAASVTTYKSANVWSGRASYIQAIP